LELSADRAVLCSMLPGIARGAADPPLFFFVLLFET
jgi:hypothetical protein